MEPYFLTFRLDQDMGAGQSRPFYPIMWYSLLGACQTNVIANALNDGSCIALNN